MARKITDKNLFKPKPSQSESKAMRTDRAYREIVSAEAKARDRKTEKLRQARLKQADQQVGQ